MDKNTINRLLAVLSEKTKVLDDDRSNLLRVATMYGVAGLFEYYREDVLAKFSIEQLQDIVNTTENFCGFTVEHIYHTALYA